MTIEVVVVTQNGFVVRSGETPSDEIEGQTAFFVRNQTLNGWITTGSGGALSKLRSRTAALSHVPVPIPSENNRRSKSRPIERKKLPPV